MRYISYMDTTNSIQDYINNNTEQVLMGNPKFTVLYEEEEDHGRLSFTDWIEQGKYEFISQEEMLEKIKKLYPPKLKSIYALEKYDQYYTINLVGGIYIYTWVNDEIDDTRLHTGNVYLTKQDAQKALTKLKATALVKKRIAELNEGWVPDWEDDDEYAYFIVYNSFWLKLDIDFNSIFKTLDNSLYLKSSKLVQQLIDEMPNELKLMLEVN